MKPENIYKVVNGIPHMNLNQAQEITSFILKYKCRNILELGFKHGVSTCYMAGAVQEIGGGKIITIDLEDARKNEPNIEKLLSTFGLSDLVEIYYEPTSYTWRLMKMIENNNSYKFDLCYLDGAHDWFTDGFAFYLIDKLLLPGGWIIFDDIDWTYADSPALKNTERVRNMPSEERESRQMRKVYDLLVKTHPNYNNFIQKGDWVFAQKLENLPNSDQPKTEIRYKNIGMIEIMKKIYNKLFR